MTETEQKALVLRGRYDLTVPERVLIERGLLLADSLGKKEYICPILKARFVLIPAGTFMMGSPEGEWAGAFDETLHRVTISKSFYLQTTPVTQGQWKKVTENNPSHFKGDDNLPVEQVSWNDVQEFLEKLNAMERTEKYRLPTEAEWEYACRAGSTTAYCFGNDSGRLGEYAWYGDNAGDKTHPVGQKKSNAWGLYDMIGNVSHWVRDGYVDYTKGHVIDPSGPLYGSNRVIRGCCCWHSEAWMCTSALRGFNDPGIRSRFIGFRLLALLSGREIALVKITADDVNDLPPSDMISSDQIDETDDQVD